MRGLEPTIEQSFGPEEAGKRVGWVSVVREERETSSEVILVNLALATVGEDGAVIKAYKDTETGKQYYDHHNGEGFESAVGYSAVVLCGDTEMVMVDHSVRTSRRNRVLTGVLPGQIMTESLHGSARKTWVESEEFLATLKQQLSDVDADDMYPKMYYGLNYGAAHPDIRPDDIASVNGAEWLLADQAMHDTTADEQVQANAIVLAYDLIKKTDTQVRKNLTCFGSVPKASIPEYFAGQRRKVAGYEQAIRNAVNEMVLSNYVELPLRAVRTWPYMDPTETNERAAFGRELTALTEEHIWPAVHQLDAELKATDRRAAWARNGRAVLELLYTAEAARQLPGVRYASQ